MWHLWCNDGGFAAVYGLDFTPAKGTQPAEGAQPRKATYTLATQAIAEHDMAKVEYSFPVDKVHGRISKQHQVGFAHRKASKLNYTTSYGKRASEYSQEELARQEKFKAVAASTRARMKDPGKVMQDQAAFKEQSKYKTFYRYVFNQEWEAYTEG